MHKPCLIQLMLSVDLLTLVTFNCVPNHFELITTGELTRLENKWWYDRSECKNSDSKESRKKSLTLHNVAGCFYILIAGLCLAMLVSFGEFVFQRKTRQKQH
jgi:uncharacterized membrane protein YvlD (DUF360 family)